MSETEPKTIEQVGQEMREMLADRPLQAWFAEFAELMTTLAQQFLPAIQQFYVAIRDRYDAQGEPYGPTDEDMLAWYRAMVAIQRNRELAYDQQLRWWMMEDFAAQAQGKERPALPERRDYGLE